ncbi:MAG: tryptophan synthase subunit alpha [Planctomycetota bacterium]
MSELDQLFQSLRASNRKAFMPFVTAGDPDVATTEVVIRELHQSGADLCEVGIPYSDPIADGPVIAASYQRALDAGFKLSSAMELGSRIAADASVSAMPRVTMVSYAIIHRIGLPAYIQAAQAAGYAGAIVPDLLSEEAEPMSRLCRDADFSLIQLVTPTTTRDRQKRIAELSTGFLYYVSVTGITGERATLPPDLIDSVGWLREQTELPICIGFGISGPETAAQLAPVADGLIVGSAIVRRIAEAHAANHSSSEIAASVGAFARSIREAIDQPTAHVSS